MFCLFAKPRGTRQTTDDAGGLSLSFEREGGLSLSLFRERGERERERERVCVRERERESWRARERESSRQLRSLSRAKESLVTEERAQIRIREPWREDARLYEEKQRSCLEEKKTMKPRETSLSLSLSLWGVCFTRLCLDGESSRTRVSAGPRLWHFSWDQGRTTMSAPASCTKSVT